MNKLPDAQVAAYTRGVLLAVDGVPNTKLADDIHALALEVQSHRALLKTIYELVSGVQGVSEGIRLDMAVRIAVRSLEMANATADSLAEKAYDGLCK